MKKIIVALTASVVVLGLIALSQSVDSNAGRFLGNSNRNNNNNNSDDDDNKNCVDSGDYTFYPYMDSNDGDIIYLPLYSIDKLKAYCNSNKACLGFNSNGWIKKSIKDQSKWIKWTGDSSKGFYVKKTAATTPSTPAVPTYTFYPYLDSNLGDIIYLPLYSVDKLKEYCNSNSACLGFNTNGWVKKALKPQSQWVKWTNDAKKGFYVKVTTAITTPTPSTPATPSTPSTPATNTTTNNGSTGSNSSASSNSTTTTPTTPSTPVTNSTTNTGSSNNTTNTTSGSTGGQTNTGNTSSGNNSTDTTTGNTSNGGSTGSTNTTDNSGSTGTTDPSTPIPIDTTGESDADPNVGGTEASTNE